MANKAVAVAVEDLRPGMLTEDTRGEHVRITRVSPYPSGKFTFIYVSGEEKPFSVNKGGSLLVFVQE